MAESNFSRAWSGPDSNRRRSSQYRLDAGPNPTGDHPGVEILTAFNGREALTLVGAGIDVLIVDY